MLPFDDNLVGVRLTGAQLVAEIGRAAAACGTWGSCSPLVSGMTYAGAGGATQVTLAGGAAIDPAATYYVLVLDYMWNGGDGYTLKARDPTPVEYGESYRQAVVGFTRQLGTTPADPLEAHVDSAPRAQ
jgi:2',3'-cyclic-nucleotide 2'-phosphodiesterase (5'-nucleotidase family)